MNDIKVWYFRNNNAGDIFTAYLLRKLGYNPIWTDKDPELICAGSILEASPLKLLESKQKNSVKIIGSGLHNKGSKPFTYNMNNFLAVRGKLTIESMTRLPRDTTVGDTGLLLSRIYKPKTDKKYKIGIITHFVDYNHIKETCPQEFKGSNIKIINMLLPDETDSSFEKLFDEINECEFIFSSSLHGIIFAHSLGIPAYHIEDKPLLSRDNFKFKDYYSSIEIPYKKILYKNLFVNDNILNIIKQNNCVPKIELINSIQDGLLKCFDNFKRSQIK